MIQIKKIRLLKQVRTNLKRDKDFFESQSQELGDYFKDCLISDIESLKLYAGIHPKYFGMFRMLSKRFPYTIYYIIEENTAIIFAVLDLRQNPLNIEKLIKNRG